MATEGFEAERALMRVPNGDRLGKSLVSGRDSETVAGWRKADGRPVLLMSDPGPIRRFCTAQCQRVGDSTLASPLLAADPQVRGQRAGARVPRLRLLLEQPEDQARERQRQSRRSACGGRGVGAMCAWISDSASLHSNGGTLVSAK
jgi:hypothetical protein